MRASIAVDKFRVTATSASWKVSYFAGCVPLAPILISFSRRVVSDQCFTSRGKASRRSKLPRLYANAKSCKRAWLCLNVRQESFVHLTALFPLLDPLVRRNQTGCVSNGRTSVLGPRSKVENAPGIR